MSIALASRIVEMVKTAPFLPKILTYPLQSRAQYVEQLVLCGDPANNTPGLSSIVSELKVNSDWFCFFESEYQASWKNRTPDKHLFRSGNDYGIHLHIRHREGCYAAMGEGIYPEVNPGLLFKLVLSSDSKIVGVSGGFAEPSPFAPQFLAATRYHEFVNLEKCSLCKEIGFDFEVLHRAAWKAVEPHLTTLNAAIRNSKEGLRSIPFELVSAKDSPLTLLWSDKPVRSPRLLRYPHAIVSPYGDLFTKEGHVEEEASADIVRRYGELLQEVSTGNFRDIHVKAIFFEALIVGLAMAQDAGEEIEVIRTSEGVLLYAGKKHVEIIQEGDSLSVIDFFGSQRNVSSLPLDELERYGHEVLAQCFGKK